MSRTPGKATYRKAGRRHEARAERKRVEKEEEYRRKRVQQDRGQRVERLWTNAAKERRKER